MTPNQVHSRFPWRIFIRITSIQSLMVLAALGASGIAARYFFEHQWMAHVENQLHDLLVTISRNHNSITQPEWCSSTAANTVYRFTVVGMDGKVICDSFTDSSTLDNHKDRPEIKQAMTGTFGFSSRFSATERKDLVYGAMLLPNNSGVVRAAIPVSELSHSLALFDHSLIVILSAIGIFLFLFAIWSGRQLIFPMGRLLIKAQRILQHPQPETARVLTAEELTSTSDSYGEWTELAQSLEGIQQDMEVQSERLTLAQAEQATIMGAISDAILAVDTDGIPLFYNSRFAIFFGGDSIQRKTRVWERFRIPEVVESFRGALTEGRAFTAAAIPFEVPGGKRFLSLSVSPLRKGRGQIYGAVGVFHDVTELKAAEQMRIDFVANVSHELRTPLTSIKGYTDTIIADLDSGQPPARRFLEIIVRNVDRLMSLIGDLLELSSLESPQILHKEKIHVREFTTNIIKHLQPALDRKEQKITVSFGTEVVAADPKRLEQVMINLLDNANKYTPPGGTLRLEWLRKENHEVALKVTDSGPGIPEEHHARLFERFYRVDKGRSRELGGTGLGLAIVKHIMQQHRGTVSVESKQGAGASFLCSFPAS